MARHDKKYAEYVKYTNVGSDGFLSYSKCIKQTKIRTKLNVKEENKTTERNSRLIQYTCNLYWKTCTVSHLQVQRSVSAMCKIFCRPCAEVMSQKTLLVHVELTHERLFFENRTGRQLKGIEAES